MSTVCLKDKNYHTLHELPKVGQMAPSFAVTKTDLSTVRLDDFKNQPIIINVYPSIDTTVCFQSVRTFQKRMAPNNPLAILCISMDLPFALKRIAEGEQLKDIILLSDFRNRAFGDLYGLTVIDGPLAGLLARAVIVLNKKHEIIYHELISDISLPPNYDAAFHAFRSLP